VLNVDEAHMPSGASSYVPSELVNSLAITAFGPIFTHPLLLTFSWGTIDAELMGAGVVF
jgi:hypothetical protein